VWAWAVVAISWLVNALVAVGEAIWTFFVFIWPYLLTVFKAIGHGADWVWNHAVKPFWGWAKDHLAALRKAWLDHVQPIIDQVYKVIRKIKDVWNTFVQPVYDTISALRTFLTLTHLNTTAFGRALDGALASIEADLERVRRAVFEPINKILHVLNEIVMDVDGVFRYAILVDSTGRHIASIARQWWNVSLPKIKNYRTGGKLPSAARGHLHTQYDELALTLEDRTSYYDPMLERAGRMFAFVVAGSLDDANALAHDAGEGAIHPSPELPA